MNNEVFQVFISYARPDYDHAQEIYEWLTSEGFVTWLDRKKNKAGAELGL